MDKKSYLLGLSMGLCICILSLVVYFNIFDIGFFTNDHQIEQLKMENAKLKSDIAIAKDKNENTKGNDKVPKKEDLKTSENIKHDVSEKTVTIELKEDMNNDKIADLLIQNGVYKHKNDLLMMMEMLDFNKNKYAEILNAYGTIRNPYYLSEALTQIESNSYLVTEVLYQSGLVQDPKAFMKLIYLLSNDSKIKYGKKEFVKDSSLREICDILIT